MHVQFKEPTKYEYLILNQRTNKIHVAMPLQIIEEIGGFFRNSQVGLRDFLGASKDPQKSLLNELTHYKEALEFDLSLLAFGGMGAELKEQKEQRLRQINVYIALINKVKEGSISFEKSLKTFLGKYENAIINDAAGNLDLDTQWALADEAEASEPSKFFTKNGWICTNFCEYMAGIANSPFVQEQLRDFATMPRNTPLPSIGSTGSIELDVSRLTDEQLLTILENAPLENWLEIFQLYPDRIVPEQQSYLLQAVAYGQQDAVDVLLKASPNAQKLLTTAAPLTDYSLRTFHCSAYEYAYWAKDTRMCRMLESHMDEETKAEMLARVKKIEGMDTLPGEPIGLAYQQNGVEQRSSHFDFAPLITALTNYSQAYKVWNDEHSRWGDYYPLGLWLEVGKEQCNVPAHAGQEICEPGRSFASLPSFNVDSDDIPKETLSRTLGFFNDTFKDFSHSRYINDTWFPLKESSGLGSKMAIIRRSDDIPGGVRRNQYMGTLDRDAIAQLDKVRTADLIVSREHLKPKAPVLGMSL